MRSLLSFFFGRNKKSAHLAKARLQAVLDQERAARGQPRKPDYLPALQRELAKVVSKYVGVQSKDIQMHLQRRHNTQVLEVKIQLPQAAR